MCGLYMYTYFHLFTFTGSTVNSFISRVGPPASHPTLLSALIGVQLITVIRTNYLPLASSSEGKVSFTN